MVNVKGRAVFYLSVLAIGSAVACAIRFTRPSVASVPVQVSLAPALQGKGADWINLPAANRDQVLSLKGHVTVLHFWTFECINCEHNLHWYNSWAADYKPDDVQIIGVHSPELAEERIPENVRNAVKKDEIKYPVLIDGEGANWNNYRQEVWPAVYLIDKKGQIRQKWEGELGEAGNGEVKRAIEALRKE